MLSERRTRLSLTLALALVMAIPIVGAGGGDFSGRIAEAGVAELQALMESGELSSLAITVAVAPRRAISTARFQTNAARTTSLSPTGTATTASGDPLGSQSGSGGGGASSSGMK